MGRVLVENAAGILNLALSENLTFCGTSYLYAAIEEGLTLVADDEKIYSTGKKHVETLNSDSI
jgi:predicted nucleic acid-binding protein